MNTNQNQMRIHTIATHKMQHIDEVVGIVFLKYYGRKKYPGIEDAKIVFWNAGSRTPDGRNWKEWYKEGYLPVGVGGSKYDEHPSDATDRKEGHCAATLIAKDLGIDNLLEVQQLLQYVVTNDTKGGNNPFDLASAFTLANKTWIDDPLGCLEWQMQIIRLYLLKQINFFTKTKSEFEKYANVFECIYQGRSVTVVAVQSDDTEIGAFARSEHGANAAIVIQQNSKKQVMISSQKRAKICFDEVIIELRRKEANLKGLNIRGIDLKADGTLLEIPHWYYDKPAARIMNGSLSAPDVQATEIPFCEVVKIVKTKLCNNFQRR